MTPQALIDRMRKLAEFISDAETSVRSGKLVNMSHLDQEVTVLCNQAISLPPAQAAQVQPQMAELIGNLERLSVALHDFKAARK